MRMRYAFGQTNPIGERSMDRNRIFKLMHLLLMIVVGACVLNFILYLAGTLVLGGDALHQGSISDGHFFIKSHGRTKEVTEGVFVYSRWQASTLAMTQPIFLAAFVGTLLIKFYAKK
jgi:hypothetical protein